MKKIVSLILAVVLMAGALPLDASAHQWRIPVNGVNDHSYTEGEPNDTLQTDNVIANDYTVYGSLSSSDLFDCFRFNLSGKTEVEVAIVSTGASLQSGITANGVDWLAIAGHEGFNNDGNSVFYLSATLEAGTYCLVMMDAYQQSNQYVFYVVLQAASQPHVHDYVDGYCTGCGEQDPNYVPPVVNPFVDVQESDWFYDSVLWALENNITAGISADHFGPNNPCTRGQVVTFLWRANGEPEPFSTESPFADVKPTDYFYKSVLWAVENGITAGTGNGLFSPNASCTRAQVATFLWRAEGEPQPGSGNNPFTDVKSGDYFYTSVLWAVENGITAGTGNGLFSPMNPCTRGQVVTFLYRADALETPPTEPEPTEPEPTEPEPTEPEPTEPEPTEPDPTEPEPTEPQPTEPESSDPVQVADPVDLGYLSERPANAVQDIRYFTYGQVQVDGKPGGTYNIYKYMSREIIEAYVAMLQENGFTLVDTHGQGTSSKYYSWGLTCDALPDLETMEQTYTDTPCHICIWTAKGWGTNTERIDLVSGLTLCDLGLRMDGNNVDLTPGGESLGVGLLRMSDGSYQTSDGRLSTQVGRAVVMRDGVGLTGEAQWLEWRGLHTFTIADYIPGESIVFELQDSALKQDAIFQKQDLESDSFVFSVTANGETRSQNYNSAAFESISVRVMYYEPEGDVVLYIHTRTSDGDPAELEALCAISMAPEPEPTEPEPTEPEPTQPEPEPTEPEPTESEPAPTEPGSSADGQVAAPIDLGYLSQRPANAVQDIRYFTYGQVRLDGKPGGTYNNYKDMSQEMIEAYVAMLQENGFTLVEAYEQSFTSKYQSWGLICDDLPELETIEQQYTDNPCHICIWTSNSWGSGTQRIDLTPGLTLCDLGIRMDGNNADLTPGGLSLGAGLFREPDGSYQTGDGRLTTQVGQSVVVRDGVGLTGDIQWERSGDTHTFTIDGYIPEESIVFALNDEALAQGTIFQKYDLESNDFTFSVTANGATRSQSYNSTEFESISVRVMYYEPEGDAVLYIHARTTGGDPTEIEALCAVSTAPEPERPMPDYDEADLVRVDGVEDQTITITTDQVLEIFYGHREWDSAYHTFEWTITEGEELLDMYGSYDSRTFFPTGTGVVIVKMRYGYTKEEPDVLTGIPRDNPKSHERTYSIIIVDP